MNYLDSLVCPVSSETIDSNVSRLTVFLAAALLGAFLVIQSPWIVAFVALDYAIRAFGDPRLSPLRWVGSRIARALNLAAKPMNAGPKLFASRLGVLFAAASALLFAVSPTASLVVAGILCGFALLDSVANFCVGCLTYHYLVFPLLGARQNKQV